MKTSSLHRLIADILVYGASAFPGTTFAQTSYNFNWNLAGDDGIAPLQVFDDGQRVYLQFPQGADVPAVFADTPAGPILLTPETRQPYTVVSGLETKLSFRLKNRTARAWRATPDRTSGPLMPGNPAPEAVTTGLATPIIMNGSAQPPVPAASIAARHGSPPTPGATLPPISSSYQSTQTIAARSGAATAVPLNTSTESLKQRHRVESAPSTSAPIVTPTIATSAVTIPPSASGIPTAVPVEYHHITLKQSGTASPALSAAPAASVNTVDITSSPSADSASGPSTSAGPAPVRWEARAGMRLSELITHWADKESWTVRWDTQLDYPIEAAFSVEADSFLDAASNVFSTYQGAQEPFSVTAYANNVLIVKGLKK